MPGMPPRTRCVSCDSQSPRSARRYAGCFGVSRLAQSLPGTPEPVTQTAGLPDPGMNRQRATAWLLEWCPDVSEELADRGLDHVVTGESVKIGGYAVTWDPETGFAIWPPGVPGDVIPVSGPEAEAMTEAARRARQRAGQVIAASGGAGSPVAWAALAAEGTATVDGAISTYQSGNLRRNEPRRGLVSHDQAAWLSATMADTRVVRHAWARMDPHRRSAHQLLWSDVTRMARPGLVAGPASLLAFTALQGGNEHLAAASLDRALADQPSYPPATLLSAARAAGLPAARYTPAALPLPAAIIATPAKTAISPPGARPACGDPELEPLAPAWRPMRGLSCPAVAARRRHSPPPPLWRLQTQGSPRTAARSSRTVSPACRSIRCTLPLREGPRT